MDLVLPLTSAAEVAMVNTSRGGATLSIIGLVTSETVAVEVPRVFGPDVNNNAHWTPLMQEDEATTIRAGNNAISVPGMLVIRLKKAAGVSGNAYGVMVS